MSATGVVKIGGEHHLWESNLIAAFEKALGIKVQKAQAAMIATLSNQLTVDKRGMVTRTPANTKALMSIGPSFQKLLSAQGYGPLITAFVGQFPAGFEFFESTMKALNLPKIDWAAKDKAALQAQQLTSVEALKSVVATVAENAKKQALFLIGGLKLNELAELLRVHTGKTLPQAVGLAETAMSMHYATLADIGYAKYEAAGLPVKFKYYGPQDSIARPFCSKLLGSAKVYTRAEIAAMDNGQIPNVMISRGGYRCRHQWILSFEALENEVEAQAQAAEKARAEAAAAKAAAEAAAKAEAEAKTAAEAAAKAKAEAEAAAAKAAAEAKAAEEAKAKATLVKVGEQLGSNPGGKYRDGLGNEFYVKFYKNLDQARTEVLTSKIYRAMGIETLEPELREVDGKLGVVTKWRTDTKKLAAADFSKLNKAQRNDVGRIYAGAVTAKNWDVVGMQYDNIVAGPGGKLVAVDQGAAFKFRAQGAAKPFGPDIAEFSSLRNAQINPQSAKVFSALNADALKAAEKALLKLKPKALKKLFKDSGLPDADQLYEAFIARRDAMLAKLAETPATAAVKSTPGLKTFADVVESNDYVKAIGKPWWNTLIEDQRKVVNDYSGSWYSSVNPKLREAKGSVPPSFKWKIEVFDKAFTHELQESLQVVRGVNFREFAGMKPGESGVWHAYTSTTVKPQGAGFGGGSTSTRMTIRLPKGTKVAPINGNGYHPSEQEIVLPRGTRFRLITLENVGGIDYAEIEVLN